MLPDHSSRYRTSAQKIADSETFSSAKVYQHLLLYLIEAALKDKISKEMTIAIAGIWER